MISYYIGGLLLGQADKTDPITARVYVIFCNRLYSGCGVRIESLHHQHLLLTGEKPRHVAFISSSADAPARTTTLQRLCSVILLLCSYYRTCTGRGFGGFIKTSRGPQ